MVQEIAIRVRLREQERLGLAEYERIVASVATVAAVVAWLPTPASRLVVRGRGAEPVRLETVSYAGVFEMLVVLDQRSAAVERAASAVAALIASVGAEHVEDDAAGVAGELDRLDRSAPRGRSAVERALREFLEGARADVLARRTTTRVRAAQALLRLAEDGAELVVERVEDALVPVVEEQAVDPLADTGAAVVVERVPGLEPAGVRAPQADDEDEPREEQAGTNDERKDHARDEQSDEKQSGKEKSGKKQSGKEKSGKEKSGKKKSGKEKSEKKKSGKEKSGKKKSGKKQSDEKKPDKQKSGKKKDEKQ